MFMHKSNSGYRDQLERHYHFPKSYLSRAQPVVGDWIVYYRPGKGKFDRVYTAIAEIESITPDPLSPNEFYYANIRSKSYLAFENLVPLKTDGLYANSLLQRPDGKPNGIAQSAVHPISESDFWSILDRGFSSKELDELPRFDIDDKEFVLEMGESPQAEFLVPTSRRVVQTTFNRKLRSRIFRKQVIRAYDKTCAFTGLRFINGGGRAEVQAAHIIPVDADGPDSLSNGIALSGTVHWMFARGLLSLSDGGDILVSRHINNTDEVDRLLVADRKARLPRDPNARPHPFYLDWHRRECFKV